MKEYREKELKYLIVLYVLLLLYWCTDIFSLPNGSGDMSTIISVLQGTMVSGILSVFVFIGDSLFSSRFKDKLVGLFFIPRAGDTIFTRIKEKKIKDDRYKTTEAQKQYSIIIKNIPDQKDEKYEYENSHWYKIYKKHEDIKSIEQAQKDYLLCRDMYAETILFFILYIISLFVFGEIIRFSFKFILTVVSMGVVTNIITHIKMHRFVSNVIATDISTRHQDKQKMEEKM